MDDQENKAQTDAMKDYSVYDNLIARQFRPSGACSSPVHIHGLIFTMFIMKRNGHHFSLR
jgi:hypothetical protein